MDGRVSGGVRRENFSTRSKNCLRSNLLTILTVLGVVGGALLGCTLRYVSSEHWTEREVMYLQYPGDIFLRMLKALIIPLLVSSIVSAIGSLDLSLSGRIGYRAILYYMSTTLSAVILGIILVVTIRPGSGGTAPDHGDKHTVNRNVLTSDTLLDLLRNVFPPNLIEACVSQFRTVLSPPDGNESAPLTLWKILPDNSRGTNVLGLVTFSVVLGITIGRMGEKARPLQELFLSLSEAMMIITGWVIWVSPIGVFFLVASKLLEIESFHEMVGQLGLYFITVLLGLFIHGFGTISLIFFICTRKLSFPYIAKMGQVLATAFGTASSSATLPVTIGFCDSQGLDPRVTRFVIPIGATINMDGTALYEAVAAIFIAQLRKVPLSFGSIVAVSLTATAASIGAAGIPQAGLVTMVMVLDTVGLPAEDVTLIIAVDWLLDRFRTTVNVMCDALGAIIVESLSRSDIERVRSNSLVAAQDRSMAMPHELTELRKAEP